MLKRGFTLAEVLITLMIVGIVATLTTPALVKNVGSSKIGPQLSKFVNTWETGVGTMMMEANASTLSRVENFGSANLEELSKYIVMSELSEKTPVKDSKGNVIETSDSAETSWWQLKDGTIICASATTPNLYEPQGSYKGPAFSLIVDIGGIKGSHRAAREVFSFFVDQSGTLIPYGSNAHKSLVSAASKYACNPSSTELVDLFSCTGAVADNGYKAPW